MNFLKTIFFVLMMTMIFSTTACAAPVPLRGIVEGFYGTPWTFEDRADMMNFCREHNLNAYIYAPKSDPYHRDKWREPYPAEQLAELQKLVDVAKANGVRFTFAISPGLDLHYTGNEGDKDFDLLLKKMEAMYKIGVRSFAIFFDDLKDDKGRHHEDGKLQAEFLNRLQDTFHKRHKDIVPLITVPTEYFYDDMIDGNKVKKYTRDFAENLDEKIVVLYTGDGVVCKGISDAQFEAANKIYRRDRGLGIWWNYPVNDYTLRTNGGRNSKLALGPIVNLPKKHMHAIYFNPMGQAQMSKIAIATGAEYANAPEIYNPQESWEKAIEEQFGDLAPAMKVFASHSQHMKNNWADCGLDDAKYFSSSANIVIMSVNKGRKADFTALDSYIDEMEKAADTLLSRLPEKYLKECRPQLEQFKRIAQADRLAVNSLKAGKLDSNLKTLRAEIERHAPKAILSELSALKFVDDVLALKW
ncbi:MAG: beta-N-acetylglucosaminidase domain-containing protein [Selenomonadaceae bacterium]|nr:beta-N-acetylglucosaminidase domain-containing protein [Selenomonadaceae bacterium]